MNITLASIDHFNWGLPAAFLLTFFAGYVTRVVIDHLKPIWKANKEVRKKVEIASIILDAERRASPNTPANPKP